MGLSVHDVQRALHDLGSVRFGEMDITEGMQEIVRTTHAVFDVDGAGLMILDEEHHLRNAAVSDDRLEHLEELQVKHFEGPCIDAFESRQLVSVSDLSAERRWPLFSPDAVARGVHAVMASPIPFNRQPIGVVAVVSDDRHPWTPEGELAIMAFTDLSALLIASMLQAAERTKTAVQLQQALDSRVVIEKAKGIVMARNGLPARAAYEKLRAQARSERRTVRAVATEIVEQT